jgi:hypothetical protein
MSETVKFVEIKSVFLELDDVRVNGGSSKSYDTE